MLICNENLSTNNEDPLASVCVFALAQGAGPPTVLCCTNCVLQSEMSHMLCIRKRRREKKVLPGPDWVNLVLLLAISPVKKETHQKQAFQPKTSESHRLFFVVHLKLSIVKNWSCKRKSAGESCVGLGSVNIACCWSSKHPF